MAMMPHSLSATSVSSILLSVVILIGNWPSSAFQMQPFGPLPTSQTSKRLTNARIIVLFEAKQRNTHTNIVNMGTSSSSSTTNDLPDCTDSDREIFQQKSILITGASRGLGKSLAHALSKCNPSLLVLSGRDESALQEVRQECLQIAQVYSETSTTPMQVEIVTCDLGDKSSVEELATTSLNLGGIGIDILINNGGISSRSSFLETKLDVDERLMQVNFFSGAALAKKLVPGMVDKGNGKVIWISSVQGKLGTPYRTSYAASKFAVQGYCEALRAELSSSNVSVHVVSPGYIRTNLSRSAVTGDGSTYNKMDETTANGDDPDNVAASILSSIAAGETDFVVAATFSAKAGVWLKFLAPSFLECMLVKRFEKQKIAAKKTEREE